MALMESKEKKQKKWIIKKMLGVAYADGNKDNIEEDLISNKAWQLGFSAKEYEKMKQNPDKIKDAPPENNREKFSLLFDLLAVSMVNREIDSREMHACRNVAEQMNLSPSIVDHMLRDIIIALQKGTSKSATQTQVESWMSR